MDEPVKNSTVIDGQFLANTIHELRTPIQTISGSLELLNETNLNAAQKDYVHQIRFSGDILLTLVNDLLDFSKINSGKFSVENIPLNPAEIVELTAEMLSTEAHTRHLEIITEIDYTIPTSVLGDPTRIKQVLLNLIKNAIKFTPSGFVHIKLSQRIDKTLLLFEVRDTGIGIAKERQQEIFSDFYQVDASVTRKYGGTGLGLSISKSLVQAMGGKIGMKSDKNHGSLFWFTIPLVIDEASTPRSLIEDHIQLVSQLDIPENTSILLIDKQPLALKSLYSKFKTLKFSTIDAATSSQTALQKMEEAAKKGKPYTLVFIDMQMDSMDGWEIAKRIQQSSTLNKTKCFLMVPEGRIDLRIKEKVFDYFENYLYKPIKIYSLTTLLSSYFNVPTDFSIINSVEDLPTTPIHESDTQYLSALGKKILIAEDHPINKRLMETFISYFGATPIVASNGQEAIDSIKNNPDIDIVFMDIHMPIKSGIEATHAIREMGYTNPIIACTANNDPEDFRQYEKSGMNDVLIKPFKRKDVAALLQKYLFVDAEENARASASTAINSLLGKNETQDFWDWNDFMDTVGGDISLGKELIVQYITQTNEFLKQAEDAKTHNDLVSLISIGHTLKGSSATLSLGNLAKIGAAIERAAKNKDVQTIEMGLKTFNEIFANFKQFVEP